MKVPKLPPRRSTTVNIQLVTFSITFPDLLGLHPPNPPNPPNPTINSALSEGATLPTSEEALQPVPVASLNGRD